MHSQQLQNYLKTALGVITIYPLSSALLLFLSWIIDNQGLQLVFDELSRRKFILLFVSDWLKALPFIIILYIIFHFLRKHSHRIHNNIIILCTLLLCLFIALVIQSQILAAILLFTYAATYLLSPTQQMTSK